MTRLIIALPLILPLALVGSCKSTASAPAEVVACDDCGVEKGTEGCCDAEAERCTTCGKIKGSPGCCK